MANLKRIVWTSLIVFMLAACSQPVPPVVSPTATTPLQALVTPAVSPSATTQPSPTPTSPPGLALAAFPPGPGEAWARSVSQAWQQAAQASGLIWQERQALSSADLVADLRLVLVFPGALPVGASLADLAAAAPQAQFVAIGVAGVSPAANLTVAGPLRYDQQGFIAGVLAAMLTLDWRVGVISISDTPTGLAARNGFLNGAVFFCGLCNPYHGPIVDYPLYVELPALSSSAEWQAAAQLLIDKAVQTVYLAPGVSDLGMLELLARSKVRLIAGYAMPGGLQASWVASILPDDSLARQQLPELLAGTGAGQLALPWDFFDTQEAFTPGKERLARQYLADLLSGYIDTGVDPETGMMLLP